mgnify:CR=1 FL=1
MQCHKRDLAGFLLGQLICVCHQRDALKELTFDKAPQGTVKMRGLDNQIVVPSYLMKVRAGWTSVNDALVVDQPGTDVVDPDEWQRLNLATAVGVVLYDALRRLHGW